MATSEELRIDWDRKGMLLPLLGAFAFVAAGWWMLVMELDPTSSSRHDNPWTVRGAGLAAVVFFGACSLMGLWMITRPSPAFRLDADGLDDRASLVRAGRIPWAEVEDVRLVSSRGQSCLAFFVRDPERLLARARPWLRPIARANLGHCGTPVLVATQFLQGRADELLERCRQVLATHSHDHRDKEAG